MLNPEFWQQLRPLPQGALRSLLTDVLHPQVEAWRKAAGQAQRAVELLMRASLLLAGLLERHKLQGQRVRLGRGSRGAGLQSMQAVSEAGCREMLAGRDASGQNASLRLEH